jgi:hypothetical protein
MRVALVLVALCGVALADDDGPLDVHVRVRAKHDKMTIDVAPDDTLRTNDYVELLVSSNAKSYVYVVQVFPDGTSTVLFPDDGDLVVDATKSTRVPTAAAEWFQLDDVVGTETIYVIASRQPIAKADEALAKEIRDIRTTSKHVEERGMGKKAPEQPPRAEHMLAAGKRGLHKVVKTDGAPALDVAAASKDDGFVVARFTFKHEHDKK